MFAQRLVRASEAILTWRKQRKLRRKQKHRNILFAWMLDFLWAAVVVLAINQYILQAYRIPSGSMRPTLLEGDRLFVNKLVYGPELFPGAFKISGITSPERGEIIVFENPSYIVRGPVFSFFHRLIYMLTLSLVDIDRDAQGNPRAQLLIKRMITQEGDRLRYRDGRFEFRLSGTVEWIEESAMQKLCGLSYPVQRLVSEHKSSELLATLQNRRDLGIKLSDKEINALSAEREERVDTFAYEISRITELYALFPGRQENARRYRMFTEGWYVPAGHMLPMGDNRDNSRDGRYFGPVAFEDVLGRASLVYWPLARFVKFSYE